ncbi:MAG: type II toxin-antitoxin system VapC family toxin, partial [Xanthomonadaceae bacterium]|nr:type II toxin-antitoxin system VapC family toxin [Xanthomonadaceae bacterium]
MRLVLDASVCLKWYLFDRANEVHSDMARDLLSHAREGSVKLLQPAIWRAEIAAVLAREMPTRAGMLFRSVQGMQTDIVDDAVVMLRAIELSVQTNHHLFDTIYHAVAIEHGIDLVTADEHY